MQRKLKELCVTALALLATQGLLAANIEGDATAEQGRIRLAGRDVLTFTQNGGFTVNKTTTVALLMVGGGGGGGANSPKQILQGGAGGGAGGVVHKESLTLMPGDYSIVIGAGGAVSENGGNTTISGEADFSLTAYGGGAGANYGGYAGGNGGSGGGSTLSDQSGATSKDAGQTIHGDEDNLGSAGGVASHQYGAGGGGGATAPGETPPAALSSTPGKGGDGYECAIVGTNVWYAGGGAGYRSGGGKAPGGVVAGGKGGGGACNKTVSEPGVDGLGGGGCGGSKGGSGVVIVSFVPDNEGDEDSDDFELTGGDELIPLYQDTVLVFRESGTLDVIGSGYVEILAVGGGGGGGALNGSKFGCGGGGAGGVVHVTNAFLTAGSYPIIIGEGGAIGANGGLTEALGLRAFGGGAGNKAASTGFGKDGASGGGSANDNGVYATNHGGRATSPAVYANKGHDGGAACHPYGAGGGGGAGAEGMSPAGDIQSTPGNGGDGYCCSIVGTNVWYGGGGAAYRGDGNRNTAVGGLGGGGAGNVAGADGFGGGGGGNAPGGKGVVIVRYRKISYETIFSGAEGGDVACRASHFIHTFTSDGTFTMPTNGMVEVLLVGGGGGGGENDPGQDIHGGAGGGAGGVVHVTNMVLAAGAYSIKLGAGGAIGANGEKTTAFDLIAYGGGAGGRYDGRSSAAVTTAPFGRIGSDGASGGGSTHVMRQETVSEDVPGGKAIYGDAGNLGHDGGICTHVFGASGGGGAGGPGGNTSGERMSSPGCGGIGYLCSISGRAQYYAGGGAGFRGKEQVDGGLGGGGSCIQAPDKQSSTPGKGEDGLGGGGCGGAAGGKGVVIVRYRYQESPGMMLILR